MTYVAPPKHTQAYTTHTTHTNHTHTHTHTHTPHTHTQMYEGQVLSAIARFASLNVSNFDPQVDPPAHFLCIANVSLMCC